MRYTLFFTSSLFPLPSSLLPAPCSLLPAPCSLKTINLYLTSRRIAIAIIIAMRYTISEVRPVANLIRHGSHLNVGIGFLTQSKIYML
ncbi:MULTISPECIES: hypothetical protein [unclassified Moorena]|uniref:hypothetical protein n=1 Tax=unclassified Moorena TaxID=2683338 RepID=UPI001400CA4C|nr:MULTISPECIES: hypothetical protein [unclassified Moorena]NEO12259.1 hypothetical protein [Moorena sp. SIO3E8]NEP98902.1 hypothetical protein [Moorena sp. SIO3F7]